MFYRLNTRPTMQQPLSEAQKAEWQHFFAPDVRALAELLQQDLRELWFDYDKAAKNAHG